MKKLSISLLHFIYLLYLILLHDANLEKGIIHDMMVQLVSVDWLRSIIYFLIISIIT